MPTYFDVLDACRKTVEGIPGFKGVALHVRKAPLWVPLQDQLPQLVIACRADLAERLHAKTGTTLHAWLEYQVYMGLFKDARWDAESLRWRLARREDLRRAFLPPKSLYGVAPGHVWNVAYDPAPAGGGPAPDNVDCSWQSFTFTDQEAKGF